MMLKTYHGFREDAFEDLHGVVGTIEDMVLFREEVLDLLIVRDGMTKLPSASTQQPIPSISSFYKQSCETINTNTRKALNVLACPLRLDPFRTQETVEATHSRKQPAHPNLHNRPKLPTHRFKHLAKPPCLLDHIPKRP